MNRTLKRSVIAIVAVVGLLLTTAGACSPADVASENLSTAADNFKIQRRIVFVNGITDKYLMVIEGRCSLGNNDKTGELSVTCKVGEEKFVKHYLGLSDNVTYFVEQTEVAEVSSFHYKVVFRPETLVPSITVG